MLYLLQQTACCLYADSTFKHWSALASPLSRFVHSSLGLRLSGYRLFRRLTLSLWTGAVVYGRFCQLFGWGSRFDPTVIKVIGSLKCDS